MGLLNWLGLDGGCEKEPMELTDENFKREVVDSDVPVLVDVWSASCAPCRALVPTMKKLACKYDGKVKIAQLNVSAGPRAAARNGVQGTPTILFFRGGRVVERIVGFRPQMFFEEAIDQVLLDQAPPGEAEAAESTN